MNESGAPALQLVESIRAGTTSARQCLSDALARIDQLNPRLNAFIELLPDDAARAAGRIDSDAAIAAESPLRGVPIAIKDNICTRVGRTTCASRILAGYRSPYDAAVIERLERAGAIIVGKTNLDEFGMGSSTENSPHGPTRNPWSTDHVPGGSSGGSAVAVATGMVPVALGSDTGGSLRQPAAMCGIVGLKPTYGRVSRYGLVAYGSSLDQVGPLARTVSDAAALLGVIAGHDPRDSTCVLEPVPEYLAALHDDALEECRAGLRIGVPREYFGPGLSDEVRAAVEQALDVYRGLGAIIVELSLPHAPSCVAVYYLVATAEASSNLARYDGVHYGHRSAAARDMFELYSRSRSEGFGPEVKRRIMLGTFALSAGYHDAYYLKALRVRRLIKEEFDRAFHKVDVIACPTTPTPAFRIGEKIDDPLAMYLADIYTVPCNLAGIPGISLPCGFSGDGLPIGLQLLGPLFGELKLLQAARLFERQTPWHTRRPPIAGT